MSIDYVAEWGGHVQTAFWEESLAHAISKVSIGPDWESAAKIVMNSMVTGK